MMKKKQLELLAPAGSVESLQAAVNAGADAVYMGGGRFGARAYADNPQGDRLLEAIDYAHLHGVKLYLTVNTLFKEQELEEELYDFLLPCYERGLDAVIVQDLGALLRIRQWFSDLPVHASTQMTLCGAEGVAFLEREGVKRVVLARELSLGEIVHIHRNTNLEIECFVHGALCYCYSGQCLFSSILGGRSGNRGRCAQPCRLAYEVFAGKNRVSRKEERTLLSPKDMCAIDLLPEIAGAGVCSLKIEGRMKRPEYTAGVVRIYRKYIDRYLEYGAEGYTVSEEDRRELLLLFNRDGFSRGYYEQHNGRDLMALQDTKAVQRDKKAYERQIAFLKKEYTETEKKIPITGSLYARAGQPMELTLQPEGGAASLTVYGASPQIPKNHPMEESQFQKQLGKTRNTPFFWADLSIQLEGPLFVPVQALNDLRRDALEKLREQMLKNCKRTGSSRPEERRKRSQEYPKDAADTAFVPVHVSVETEEQLEEVLAVADGLKGEQAVLSAIYTEAFGSFKSLQERIRKIHGKGFKAYVALPHIFRLKTRERFEKEKAVFDSLEADGFVLRNLEEYEFLRETGRAGDRILDHNVYTCNRESRSFWREQGICMQTNPLELNSRELQKISSQDSIQVIYGRYPMMVTAGCLHKTLGRCRGQEEVWMLKDRYQKEFPVKNHCQDCYNIIYNSQPVYLLDQWEELKKLRAGAYRLMFTTEKKEEVRQVLLGLLDQRKPSGDFTRGHFKRGVE